MIGRDMLCKCSFVSVHVVQVLFCFFVSALSFSCMLCKCSFVSVHAVQVLLFPCMLCQGSFAFRACCASVYFCFCKNK